MVRNKDDTVEAEIAGRKRAVLAWKGEYGEGDGIIFSLPEESHFYIIHVDGTMDEALIYGAGNELVYEVPFAESKTFHNPGSSTGERHYLTMRYARDYEIKSYRNLAKNVMDQHRGQECYPHAHANVETREEAVFVTHNAIDGMTANLSHGKQPYESWGVNIQDDAQMMLEFGRPVDFDQIVLYTRADSPHDSWWGKMTFTFPDGTSETAELEKNVEPYIISLEYRGITWLTFGQPIKADDSSPFPALTQVEVYGRGHETTLQGFAGSGMKEAE